MRRSWKKKRKNHPTLKQVCANNPDKRMIEWVCECIHACARSYMHVYYFLLVLIPVRNQINLNYKV